MKKSLPLIEIAAEETDPLVKLSETCVYDLIRTFLVTPFLFYTENDLHCILYKLLSKRLEETRYGLYETLYKKVSTLLHKEYPTKKRYRKPVEDPAGRRRHFDLCIWNPDEVDARPFRSSTPAEIDREQRTYIAFEFLLVEGTGEGTLEKAMKHTQWVLQKLKDNQVEYGYVLLFARDWSFREDFLSQIQEQKIPSNITLLYVEHSNGQNIVERL
jgi:hypothetical protein